MLAFPAVYQSVDSVSDVAILTGAASRLQVPSGAWFRQPSIDAHRQTQQAHATAQELQQTQKGPCHMQQADHAGLSSCLHS